LAPHISRVASKKTLHDFKCSERLHRCLAQLIAV
jgi:hypothetical protein